MSETRDAVNAMPDRIGKWAVNYYGASRFCIEETDGPGSSRLVKVFSDMDEAYTAAMNHNANLRKA